MVLTRINFYQNGRKKSILAKKVSIFSTGLLFKKNSPPLLFSLSSTRNFSIFSIFCSPFKAIWLDENMKVTKVIDVKTWKFKITGRGKYLLEVPITTKK